MQQRHKYSKRRIEIFANPDRSVIAYGKVAPAALPEANGSIGRKAGLVLPIIFMMTSIGASIITAAAFAQQPIINSAMGNSVTSPPEAGPPMRAAVRTVSFGDWTLRCIAKAVQEARAPSTSATPDQCEIAQAVTATENGKPVQLLDLAVSPARDKAGTVASALIVLTPLDVLLSSDFGLETGHGKPALYRFRNCNHLGCFAVVPLKKSLLASLKKDDKGAAYFRLLNGQTVKVVFSLKGFGPALDALAPGKDIPSANNAIATSGDGPGDGKTVGK